MKAKARIFFDQLFGQAWHWEIITDGRNSYYVTSWKNVNGEDGYASAASAKRAAKRAAEKLGIEITEWEVE